MNTQILFDYSHGAREWRQFGLSIQTSPEERLERIAYAWIFYQVKWHDADINDLPESGQNK